MGAVRIVCWKNTTRRSAANACIKHFFSGGVSMSDLPSLRQAVARAVLAHPGSVTSEIYTAVMLIRPGTKRNAMDSAMHNLLRRGHLERYNAGWKRISWWPGPGCGGVASGAKGRSGRPRKSQDVLDCRDCSEPSRPVRACGEWSLDHSDAAMRARSIFDLGRP